MTANADTPIRSWDGFPFDVVTGQVPNARDTAPERTGDGDFVLYHGTSRVGADAILAERRLAPDDLGCVGVTTLPGAAQVFASMKRGEVLRLVIDKEWLSTQKAVREIGGSGRDQFLIQPADIYDVRERRRSWPGVPVEAVKAVSVYDFDDAD